MKPKISIIVPFYNVEPYIRKCLDSLVNQTMKEIEVILINDGSTDRSAEIAQQYVDQYAHFAIYHKDNGGPGEARNYGMRFMSGEYVIFLDSDDMLPPDACSILYKKAVTTDSQIVIGKPVWKKADGTEEPVEYLNKWFEGDLNKNYREDARIATGFPVVTSKLFLTSLILNNNISFPPGIIGEDVPFSVYTYFYSTRITITDDVVYWRTERIHDRSITQTYNCKAVEGRIQAMRLIYEFCLKHQLYDIIKYNYYQLNNIRNILLKITDQREKEDAFITLKKYLLSVNDEENKKLISHILGADYQLLFSMFVEEYEKVLSTKYEYISVDELAKLRQYNSDLLKAKQWLEEQLENYKKEVEKQNQMIKELKEWIAQLEENKKWWNRWKKKLLR